MPKVLLAFSTDISEKKDLPQSLSSLLWVAKIESALFKGLRTGCRKTAEFEIDVDVSHTVAKI